MWEAGNSSATCSRRTRTERDGRRPRGDRCRGNTVVASERLVDWWESKHRGGGRGDAILSAADRGDCRIVAEPATGTKRVGGRRFSEMRQTAVLPRPFPMPPPGARRRRRWPSRADEIGARSRTGTHPGAVKTLSRRPDRSAVHQPEAWRADRMMQEEMAYREAKMKLASARTWPS
jgi:hypothetical protein